MFHLICNPVKPVSEMNKAELLAKATDLCVSNNPEDQKTFAAVLNALHPLMTTKEYLNMLDDMEAALEAVLSIVS